MKKAFLMILFSVFLINLCSCVDKTTYISALQNTPTTEEESIDVNIVSSNTYSSYVYKDRLKIISTLEESNNVSDFFVKNLGKEDILAPLVEQDIFEEYALLTGYVNVSFLDASITVENVTKKSNVITVHLVSDFDNESSSLSDRVELDYVYFIIQIDKDLVDSSCVLDVEFITDSTYEFSNQPAYSSDIQIEHIFEFRELDYEGPIIKVDSVESFNLLKSSIEDSNSLDDLPHDSTFFETNSYIFANYIYSWEYVVNILGIEIQGTELKIVVTGNASENSIPVQSNIGTKLFVIDVLKSTINNVESFSFKNYNLFNGDDRSIIDNNNIYDTYNLIDFELIDSIFGESTPHYTCSINNVDELNETIQAWESSQLYGITYLNDYSFDADFFIDKQIVILPLTYRSGDYEVQISEIRNYGSYFEIITTTDNTEFGDQTYGIYTEVFIISISKNQLSDNPIFLNSMIYLGD